MGRVDINQHDNLHSTEYIATLLCIRCTQLDFLCMVSETTGRRSLDDVHIYLYRLLAWP